MIVAAITTIVFPPARHRAQRTAADDETAASDARWRVSPRQDEHNHAEGATNASSTRVITATVSLLPSNRVESRTRLGWHSGGTHGLSRGAFAGSGNSGVLSPALGEQGTS